jgi:M6 family metalloprotease-like protein
MPARCLAVWLTVFCAAASAQVRTPSTVHAARTRVALEHARVDQSSSILVPSSAALSDTVRILAVMVDFQTSPNSYTSGNGHFQLDTSSARNLIDPPPHDSAYFAYKLQFLANYFRKVSNGKVNIKGDVFGRLITLSKTMAQYSPAKDGSNNAPLGNLIVDTWHTADSLYPALQFSKYDAFLIFHAGVGRDIDLVASLGYDPTPYDLPTITFNLRTLRNFLGDQSYAGVPVSKGSFRITNTMLLPETDTRVITSGTVVDTIQASTNGLLANSFGSYLGLPDLFNTSTGAPGIGQFGLMDPVGGFGFYNGLFPPEPSAWEKIYLGWVTPITVGAGTTPISLPAVGLKTGRDTVYKVPISDREYFLIENRMRDPKQDGMHLTIRSGGSIVTRFFPRDTTGFNFQDVSFISGSVIDVEDFDWALPSLTSIEDSNYVGGGILIWHIDENVIAQGLATNTVNADPSHRGVDLEEADGSQDIGRSYDPFTEAGAGTEWGYEQDFWYSGNPISVYSNVFDKNSQPNSRSYSGAMSLVTVRNFSKRTPRMSALVDAGDSDVKRLQGFARTITANSFVTSPSTNGSTVLFGADNNIYAFRGDGSSKTKDTSGLLFRKGGGTALASTALGSNLFVAGVQDSTLIILNTFGKTADAVIDSASSVAVSTGGRLITPAMFADLIIPSIVVGSAQGTVLTYSYAGVLQKKTVVSSSPVSSLTQLPTPSLSKPAELFFTCGGRLYSEQSSVALGDSSFPWIAAGVVNRSGNYVVVAQRGGQKVMAFSRDLSQKMFEVTTSGSGILSVAAADIEGIGEKDVVILAPDRLIALNRTGAYVSGFPVSPSGGWSFVGDPLIGDVNGDGQMDILAMLTSGNVVAYDNRGRVLSGYPIQLASTGETPVAFFQTAAGNIGIVGLTKPTTIQVVPLGSGSSATVTSATGASVLQALELTKPYRSDFIAWSQYLKDGRHSNYDATAGGTNPVSGDFLPHARVYNWPNPVYGSTTQIRYYTPEDATISIKILDLAGTKITELNTTSRGGLDGEITWDVSKVQSGVYLARIEAKGASRSEVATIKIAVVK